MISFPSFLTIHPLILILLFTFIDGLLAFVGIFSLWMSDETFSKMLLALVSLSAGALLGGAIFHLFKKSLEYVSYNTSAYIMISGLLFFFIMERYMHWHHEHKWEKDNTSKIHPTSMLILFGDGIHNIFDGLIIAGSFLVSVKLGLTTSLMVFLHEIPQELGDFGALVYYGMDKKAALIYSFLAQLTCILGGILGYFVDKAFKIFPHYLLPFAAGGFLYISMSDLIPEIHKEKNIKKATISAIVFVLGLLMISLL